IRPLWHVSSIAYKQARISLPATKPAHQIGWHIGRIRLQGFSKTPLYFSFMSTLWNFALNVIAIAAGLWVVVEFIPGIELTATQGKELTAFLMLAAVFVIVNAVGAPFLRIVGLPRTGITMGLVGFVVNRLVGLPLTCITLGLFALVINGIVLLLAEWLFNLLGFQGSQFHVDGLWPAILGAIVLAIISGIVNFFTSPLRARS